MSLGATGIYAYGDFTDDYTGDVTELQNPLIPVPHAYVTYGITPQLTAGLGFFVPYGLGTKWPDTFEGRFNGYDNDLRSLYFQPTLAYRIHPMVSVGAGFDFVLGSVELNQRLDLSEFPAPAPAPTGTTLGQAGIPFHTDFANVHLTAHGATGFGGNFGLLLTPHERVSIGVRYLSRVKLSYEGEAVFDQVETGITLPAGNPFGVPAGTPLDAVIAGLGVFADGGPLADQGGDASIIMPDQISAGVAVSPIETVTFLAEWQWVHWALFDELELTFENAGTEIIEENYGNTNGFRTGVEVVANPRFTVRAGYLYHQGAAPPETVTPLLPEGSRNEFTGGLGIRINDQFHADIAYQYIHQNKRRGRVREPVPGTAPSVALNSGLYKFNAHLFGLTLTATF